MKPYTVLVLVALVCALHARRVVRQVPLSTGHFSGRQEGDALTRVNSESDTATGVTRTGVKGMLANSGKLRGAADAQGADGGLTRSAYAGDMSGNGGMWADTQSQAGPLGQNSRTALKGFLNDGGAISGSIGTGQNH